MSLIDTAQLSALTGFLDATVQRHQTISNNIANVDTPGLMAVKAVEAFVPSVPDRLRPFSE